MLRPASKHALLLILLVVALTLGALSLGKRSRLYSLDEIPAPGEPASGNQKDLAAIQKVRSRESKLPFYQVPRGEWLVKADELSDGSWKIEYFTAAHVPQYSCIFLLSKSGEIIEDPETCKIIK